MTKTEVYEEEAKDQFINEPAIMKLLIVVNKLLTGFDAPSCTYLYIDKEMHDHGLFQAICRVNRLDGDDKEFGYIIDYKDLFKSVENAVAVYTSELDYDDFNAEYCDILLQDKLSFGKERLDDALDALELICEDVEPPRGDLEYIHYFCGNTEVPEDLKATEVLRNSLYKAIVAFIRAYSNVADVLYDVGYSESQIEHIKSRLDYYLKLREIIRHASGETIDLKAYESDMRHLIDNYIEASDSVIISPFGETPLIDIIVKTGIAATISGLPSNISRNKGAVAESIENNVRKRIFKDHLLDPMYFEEMSKLLDEIIKQRKQGSIGYQEYLKKIEELARNVSAGKYANTPTSLDTPAKVALWNNLEKNEDMAITVDNAIKESRSDDWRGSQAKENLIKTAMYKIINDVDEVERIFSIIKLQQEY